MVAWDEVFDLFGGKDSVGDTDGLHPDTVIQQWRWSWDHLARTKDITDAGLRMLWMVDTTWFVTSLSFSLSLSLSLCVFCGWWIPRGS